MAISSITDRLIKNMVNLIMDFQLTENLPTIYGRQTASDISSEHINPYPTSPFQQAGSFMLFFFPVIAIIFVALRVFSRYRIKQFGWGMYLGIAIIIAAVSHFGTRSLTDHIHRRWSNLRCYGLVDRWNGSWLYGYVFYCSIFFQRTSIVLLAIRFNPNVRNVGMKTGFLGIHTADIPPHHGSKHWHGLELCRSDPLQPYTGHRQKFYFALHASIGWSSTNFQIHYPRC